MPALFDPSTDFEDVVDGLEAVTLLRRGTSSTAIANALRRNLNRAEVTASDGKYTMDDTRWHFPVIEADQPQAGDVLLDGDGNRHTLLEVREDTLSARWRCVTRDLAVFHGLNAVITIEKARQVKGTHGAYEATWSVWKAGVRARIQPMADTLAVMHDAKVTDQTVQIFVEDDPGIKANQRIKAPDGTHYMIQSYTGSERIGELATIAATEEQWRN